MYHLYMSSGIFQLTLSLPRKLFSTFRQESEEFLAAKRLAAAVKWYEPNRVSQAKQPPLPACHGRNFLLRSTVLA